MRTFNGYADWISAIRVFARFFKIGLQHYSFYFVTCDNVTFSSCRKFFLFIRTNDAALGCQELDEAIQRHCVSTGSGGSGPSWNSSGEQE